MPTPMRSTPWQAAPARCAPRMNCAQNRPKRNQRLAQRHREARDHRHREDRLRGREEQLLALHRVERQPVQPAGRDREHDRQRADQQRPLVHLRGDERAEARVRVEPPRVQPGDEQLRRLRRQRRDPLHQQELAHAERLARGHQRLGEPLGEQQDHRGREHRDPDRPRSGVGIVVERPEVPRRSDEVRLLGGCARDADRVRDEDADQDRRVDQRDRSPSAAASASRSSRPPGSRSRSSARGRGARPPIDRSASFTSRPRFFRRKYAMKTTIVQPDADQQPVRAGHVRERERARRLRAAVDRQARRARLRERLAALRREHEVDRVLGQHRDQREDRDREPGGDVELRDLGGPRQHERGAHDREAEQERLERMRRCRGG